MTIKTSVFGSQCVIPLDSGSFVSHAGHALEFDVEYPVIGDVSGVFICREGSFTKRVRFNTHISNFTTQKYSQLMCHGTNYMNRWCKGKNIGLIKSQVIFHTPAEFNFPSPFLCPGSRSPPYDRVEDRLYGEPIIVHKPASSITNYAKISEQSYIIGRFYNSMMMWHILFDFLVPSYHTILRTENQMLNHNRRLFIKDYEKDVFPDVISLLSSSQITYVRENPNSYLLSKAVIGLAKLEINPKEGKEYNQMFKFEYPYDSFTAPGLRDYVITSNHIDLSDPIDVLIINRRTGNRRILNPEELVSTVENLCPSCTVKIATFESMSITKQIATVANTRILLGVHGSGLAHVLWMKPSPSSFLIELLPYNYWCRKWYQTAAKVANVTYLSFENPKPKTVTDEISKCLSSRSKCYAPECHDSIRDQSISVNHQKFRDFWATHLANFSKQTSKKA